MRCLFLLSVVALAAAPVRSQWVEQPGKGWVQWSVFHHDTERVFNAEADVESIFADGHAVTTSLYLTAAGGIVKGVDAWLQAPIHRLEFDDAAGERSRIGFGDPRIFLRAGAPLLGFDALPIAVRGGVKIPGGDFPIDAEIIPLGEGQTDWELMLEVGHSLFPLPVYAMAWAGYRWRESNAETAVNPGNEWFAYVAAGGAYQSITWKVAGEGWTGDAWVIQGGRVESARREMLQVLPSVGYDTGFGVVEIGARIPLAGRNLPAGPAAFVGFFKRWSAW